MTFAERGSDLAQPDFMPKHLALLVLMTASSVGCLGEIETGPIIAIDEAAILANVAMYRDTARCSTRVVLHSASP